MWGSTSDQFKKRSAAGSTPSGVADAMMRRDTFFAALGHLVGMRTGSAIPVIDGVPAATQDQLKASGAAGGPCRFWESRAASAS